MEKGDRVRLNAAGKEACSRHPPNRRGIIISVSRRPGLVNVHWDGLKNDALVSARFLELTPNDEDMP